MAKFTLLPTDTFKKLTLNAGVMLTEFNPTTATVQASNILGATSGGLTFEATPSFTDLGNGVDNCPENTKELKKLESWEAKATGTLLTVVANTVKSLTGLADVEGNKITPRNDIDLNDFSDLWFVADYSELNGAKNGGFVAVHILNALSTGGFKMQTGDKEKGKFDFEYTAHYSIETPDTVPFEIYVKAGEAE